MNNDRDILLVAVFTFLTVASWIFFELIKTAKTTTVTSQVQMVTTPLSPTLNTEVLTVLESRQSY